MKKILPSLVTGFGAGVLHIVPIAKSFSCCLIVPLAAFLAVNLEKKSKKIIGVIDLKRGALIGFLTGVFAALFGSFFDIFITFITRNNDILLSITEIINMIDELPFPQEMKIQVIEMMQNIVSSIKSTGFSSLYASAILLNNFIVNPIFGLIGGIVGTKIINSRSQSLSR